MDMLLVGKVEEEEARAGSEVYRQGYPHKLAVGIMKTADL
jgi:hypothetical protein